MICRRGLAKQIKHIKTPLRHASPITRSFATQEVHREPEKQEKWNSGAGSSPATYVELLRLKAEKSQFDDERKKAIQRTQAHPTSTQALNNVLRSLLRIGLVRDAQVYFFRVRNETSGIVAQSSYNVLLTGYANYDETFLADKLFSLLRNDFAVPEADCYASMIRAFVNANLTDEAVSLFQEMQSHNLPLNESAVRSVAAGLFQAERIAEAEHYLSLIKEKSLDDYLIAARGYARVKDVDNLTKVFSKLQLGSLSSSSSKFLVSKLLVELAAKNLQDQLLFVLQHVRPLQIQITWDSWKELELYSTDKRNLVNRTEEGLALWNQISSLISDLEHDNPPFDVQLSNIHAAVEQHYERKLIHATTDAPAKEDTPTSHREESAADVEVDDHWTKLINECFQDYQDALEAEKQNIEVNQASRRSTSKKTMSKADLRKLRLKENKVAKHIMNLAES